MNWGTMNDHERPRHACHFVEHFPVVDPNHATVKHVCSRQGHSFSITGGFILLCFYFPALVKCCNETKFGEYVSKGVAQPPDSLFGYGYHCLFTKGFFDNQFTFISPVEIASVSPLAPQIPTLSSSRWFSTSGGEANWPTPVGNTPLSIHRIHGPFAYIIGLFHV